MFSCHFQCLMEFLWHVFFSKEIQFFELWKCIACFNVFFKNFCPISLKVSFYFSEQSEFWKSLIHFFKILTIQSTFMKNYLCFWNWIIIFSGTWTLDDKKWKVEYITQNVLFVITLKLWSSESRLKNSVKQKKTWMIFYFYLVKTVLDCVSYHVSFVQENTKCDKNKKFKKAIVLNSNPANKCL